MRGHPLHLIHANIRPCDYLGVNKDTRTDTHIRNLGHEAPLSYTKKDGMAYTFKAW